MIRKSYLTVLKNQIRRGRLLWPLRQALKLPAIRIGSALGTPLSGPIHGTFFTTYACNLRCHFCDLPYRHLEYKKGDRRELARTEKLQVIDDFATIGTTAIGFTGGEPMLDPHTPDLIASAVGKGILTHLSSNGFAFRTEDDTRALFDIGLHGVSISIDGATAETHNAIRGSARSFDDALTSITNLLAVRDLHPNKMSVTTTTVITKDNCREIPAMVDMLISMGVDQIGFMPVQDIGLDYDVAARSDAFLVPASAELDELVEYLIEAKHRTGRIENTVEYLRLFPEAFRGSPLPIRCHAGYNTLAVDSWGDIYPCFPWAEMRRASANTREMRLADFWRSESAQHMRCETSACRDCYWNNHTELNLMIDRKRREVSGYTRAVHSQAVPDSIAHHIEKPLSEHA